MKHIVIFQGIKYISSKRASKISGYSSDYIGQLCRQKKLDSRMFGHTWFISEESLLSYKDGLAAECIEHSKMSVALENLVARSELSPSGSILNDLESSLLGADVPEQKPERLSTKSASQIFGYTSDYIGQLCRGGKLDSRMIGNTWYITRESLEKHQAKIQEEKSRTASEVSIADFLNVRSEGYDLLPILNKGAGAGRSSADTQYETVEKKITTKDGLTPSGNRSDGLRALQRDFRSSRNKKSLAKFLAMSCFSAVFFVAIMSISVGLISPQNSAISGNAFTANAFDAVKNVFSYFGQAFDSVTASIFSPSAPAVHVVTIDDQLASGVGIAIAPSTGSTTADNAVKEQIQNSFSDQVEVHPDMNGESGVITPVFKESKGKNFVYVLVPINKKNQTAP